MEREHIAYLLIFATIVAAIAGIFYARYHSHAQTYRRQLGREHAAYTERNKERLPREV